MSCNSMSKRKLILLAVTITILGGSFVYANFLQKRAFNIPLVKINEIAPVSPNDLKDVPRLAIMATNLQIPWALVFLPDKSILFTERPGRVSIIESIGILNPNPVAVLNDVKHSGEGGLLGVTIHPDFLKN